MAGEEVIRIEGKRTTKVSQGTGSCGIHQTDMTTILIETNHTADDQKVRELTAVALREINDDIDYNSVAGQVSAIEEVVEKVKQQRDSKANMVEELEEDLAKNQVEELEKELAELKRELEHYRKQERGGTTSTPPQMIGTVARALHPDGIKSKLRCARDILNLILGDD